MIEFKDGITVGEITDAAIEIAQGGDPKAGERFIEAYARHIMAAHEDMKGGEAIDIALGNIRYLAGYYTNETSEQVRRYYRDLFPVNHALLFV